ncbi:DMT family transporter [Aliikangiella sp. G2MR2-5]|uniref:DMT family transporter n=1 Tax=Aliikangiella sp. G2MR2-5 TaxID=2788943 RepID=UPI0018A90C1C|nr:DMT family transporter [Aliikangiella sp. G2MR2-5]
MSNSSQASIRYLLMVAMSAILLMGFVPVIIKWISANEATIGIVRLSIGTLGISILLFFKRRSLKLTRRDLRWLILLGLVFALHWFTYFKSIKLSDASLAAIGVATFGLHLLFLNLIFYREKLIGSDFIAVIIAFAGIFLASPPMDLEQGKLDGFLIAILSGFLYACLPLINRQLNHLSTNTRALGQFGFALVGFLFLLPQSNFSLSTNDWWGLIFLGVLSTLIAHTLWIKASTELPTSYTAVLYYSYIPMAIILGYFFLGEPLNWEKLVGAGLIILANIMVALLHKKK